MSASEEKAESKPFDSEYYGWSHRINESRKVSFFFVIILIQELEKLGVDITPNRIEGATPVEEKTESSTISYSKWNSAGTWYELVNLFILREERNLTKWATTRIPEIFETFSAEKNGVLYYSCIIMISSLLHCPLKSVKVRLLLFLARFLNISSVYLQGRKKPGFDMNLKISWTASSEGEDDASGYINVNDVCIRNCCIIQFSDMSDGDYEWAFKANKSDEVHIKAKAAVQSYKKDIQKLLEMWISEFKQK